MNYKCDICPAEFKTQRGLDNHKHRWFCPVCNTKLTTKAGYERHVKRHEGEVERKAAEKRQREMEEQNRRDQFAKDLELLKERGLFTPIYKPGDKVILSTYHVTKPTHEWRFTRWVRVRYEEERRYYAREFTIREVVIPTIERAYIVRGCLNNNVQYPVVYMTDTGVTFVEAVFDNLKDAERDAAERQKAYDQGCREAAMYR